ncbi:DUF4236 domain-containing protein [Phytohabitans sp. ZYX-F-186]|uniref:DUF4236 domain-containing protein n=1 Tax=Phytohabitans maris TaxID=3071409 RepID=A0ABU0ZIX0_9ACTN|nr:DUF4236 domain-containing protein [Phytohabitans sp. ZYX-F-186]MDQ7906230.1 DUF4236 domain-containing protein [Phytohabitans sp. ZYX-F-186]
MGFYLGTSLTAGPFRLNLSPSGIGISAGVPGFRIGTGPRGNVVRVSGLGTYYSGPPRPLAAVPHEPYPPALAQPGDVVLRELDGASVQHLVAVHPSDIVSQLRAATRRVPLWPFAAGATALLALLTIPFGLALLVPGVPAVVWLYLRDRARRSVVVFYQVDGEPAACFERLAAAHQFSAQAHRAWHVEARSGTLTPYQQKVNAGAHTVVRHVPGRLTTGGPPVLVTNVLVPSLHTRTRSVYFLPDRALLRQGSEYAELPYASLRVSAAPQRFIEGGAVPRDSRVVDTTWQYTNVRGGPDRRFKNNRQLPVMLYGRLTLSTPQGFYMAWDFSRPEAAEALADGIRRMAR